MEIKTADADISDLTRGVFQCIKYRAVLRAEQKALGSLPNANTILVVSGKLSLETSRLAKILDVEFIEVKE